MCRRMPATATTTSTDRADETAGKIVGVLGAPLLHNGIRAELDDRTSQMERCSLFRVPFLGVTHRHVPPY